MGETRTSSSKILRKVKKLKNVRKLAQGVGANQKLPTGAGDGNY